MMKNWCLLGIICRYSPCGVGFPIFIFCIFIEKEKKEREDWCWYHVWYHIAPIYPEGMCATLSDNATMNNIHHGKGKAHATPESLWENLDDQSVIDTGIKNIIGKTSPEVWK